MKTTALKILKPALNGIRVNFVRKVKGGVVLDLAAQQDLEKVIGNVEFDANKLKVTEARKRMPRIILYDVPVELTEDEIREALKSQNDAVARYCENADLKDNMLFRFAN